MSDPLLDAMTQDVAVKAVRELAGLTGLTIDPVQVEAIAALWVGAYALATGAAVKKANAAGVAAAAAVTTVEQANAVMAAAADKESK